MQNRQRISAQRLRQRPVDALVWNVSKLSYNNWKNWSRKIVRIRQSSYLKCFESRSNLWVIHSQIGVNGLFQIRSEEHTSELQSLIRISYAVFCLKKTTNNNINKMQ